MKTQIVISQATPSDREIIEKLTKDLLNMAGKPDASFSVESRDMGRVACLEIEFFEFVEVIRTAEQAKMRKFGAMYEEIALVQSKLIDLIQKTLAQQSAICGKNDTDKGQMQV